jgi:hypothetical protein
MRLLCMTLIITGPYPRVNGCPAADSSHIMLRFSFSTPREALPRPQRQKKRADESYAPMQKRHKKTLCRFSFWLHD